MAKVCVGFL